MINFETPISSANFPIISSMYLLIKIECELQNLTNSINKLCKNIIELQ